MYVYVYWGACVLGVYMWVYLADLGGARGCSKNIVVIHSLSAVSESPFPSLPLRRRHAQTFRDGAASHKIDYVTQA